MHHLNIPTTRALAVIKTGEKILEIDMIGAILVRVTKSHISKCWHFSIWKNSKKNIKNYNNR